MPEGAERLPRHSVVVVLVPSTHRAARLEENCILGSEDDTGCGGQAKPTMQARAQHWAKKSNPRSFGCAYLVCIPTREAGRAHELGDARGPGASNGHETSANPCRVCCQRYAYAGSPPGLDDRGLVAGSPFDACGTAGAASPNVQWYGPCRPAPASLQGHERRDAKPRVEGPRGWRCWDSKAYNAVIPGERAQQASPGTQGHTTGGCRNWLWVPGRARDVPLRTTAATSARACPG
jgi:hypothetical protein